MSSSQIATVESYLRNNLAGEVRNRDLAALVGLSVHHFCREFKKATGLAPRGYLTEIRINQAKLQLHSSHGTLTDIAFSVGYNSSQAFARAFLKHTGLRPSQFRREAR